jgi:hypothetical protein
MGQSFLQSCALEATILAPGSAYIHTRFWPQLPSIKKDKDDSAAQINSFYHGIHPYHGQHAAQLRGVISAGNQQSTYVNSATSVFRFRCVLGLSHLTTVLCM